MRFILISVWPLLTGLLMIMLGHGLQGTLLGLRANEIGFPVQVTGLMMSLYFGGFLVGSYIIPHVVATVGHIRVFAAMASLASTAILLNGLYDAYWIWGITRILTGFSFACIYIVAESWLNNAATNKNRGTVFSTYLFVLNVGLFGGQFFIMLAPISDMHLFVLVSVLISLSLVPLSLIHRPTPSLDEVDAMPVSKLLKASPLAVFGVLSTGLCGGTFFTIGAVVVDNMGMPIGDIAQFMAAYVLGCALMPVGIGWLSDKVGRRRLIITTSALAMVAILSAIFTPISYLFILSFLCGGFLNSLHGLSMAHANDYLRPSEFVAASSSMIMVNGFGACLGPFTATLMMEHFGNNSFFIYLAGALLALTLMGIYRSIYAETVPLDEQTDFIPLPQNATAVAVQITSEDE
jgi:MFS family permease